MTAPPLLSRLVTTAILVAVTAISPIDLTDRPDNAPAEVSAVAASRPIERNGTCSAEADLIGQLVSHHQGDLQAADLILESSPLSPELEGFRVEMLASRTAQLQEMEQWLRDHGLPSEAGLDHGVGTRQEATGNTAAAMPESGSDIARLLIEHRTEVISFTEEEVAAIEEPEATTLITEILAALEEEKLTLGAFLGTISDTSLADR